MDALYDAVKDYTVATGAHPKRLYANRGELMDAIRPMQHEGWVQAFDAGTLLGMRLDLSAPPGVWSVDGLSPTFRQGQPR